MGQILHHHHQRLDCKGDLVFNHAFRALPWVAHVDFLGSSGPHLAPVKQVPARVLESEQVGAHDIRAPHFHSHDDLRTAHYEGAWLEDSERLAPHHWVYHSYIRRVDCCRRILRRRSPQFS